MCLLALALPFTAQAMEIDSPDGRVRADVSVEDGRLVYRVLLGEQELLARSPLGLDSSAGDFHSGVRIVSESAPSDVNAPYDLPAGKASRVDYRGREGVVTMENASGQRLDVRFRLANDGVAFSYRFPADAGEAVQVRGEATSFAFPTGTTSFLHPMAVSKSGWMRTQPSYEEYYLIDRPVGEPSPWEQGWCLPALFKVAERGWALVGETGVDGGYFGGRLAHASDGGVYRIELPQEPEHMPSAPVEPTVAGGRWLPWRIVIVGETLAPILASTMATDLVEPLYEVASRPTPGRAAWSWLALKDENTIEAVQRQFIDMAAELKFEYVLVDALWDTQIGKPKIGQLADYARGKGVGLLLWYNSNGSWNDAPQTPQDRMHTPEARAEEMAWLEKIGIKGVKIDFFGGDKQAVMQLYDAMLRDAARHGLCVNFHGATIPRGWDRMYPNFVTCEAVRGMEYCTFEQRNADLEAQHATMLPFTRNVIGPMDFTPLMASERLAPYRNSPRRKTTLGFELALPVVFYSAVQHFGLVPDDLERLPDDVQDYLRELPTTWDETRLVDGYPGRHAVLARRKGERWYIGAINGLDEPLTISIPAGLAENWQMLRDDGQGGVVEETIAPPQNGAAFEIQLPVRGGAVLRSK
jgi:hypothetical protein